MKCDYKLPPANINCNGYKPTKQVFSFVGGGNLCLKHVRPSLTNKTAGTGQCSTLFKRQEGDLYVQILL